MSQTFKGWIPTVSGRLSFSVVGNTSHPTAAIYANVADVKHRYIVCYQKRWLSDAPFLNLLPRFMREFIARHFFKLEGSFWFLCIAKSPNEILSDDPMEGALFVFTRKLWKGEVEDFIKQGQEKLNKYRTEHPSSSIEGFFEDSHEKLLEFALKSSNYSASFKLKRNGIAELTTLESNNIDSPAILDRSSSHSLASQLYFYLKDITHRHQHHNPSTDIPIDLNPVEKKEDYDWCSQTLRVLYRQLLRFKQFPSEHVINCSLGLLAYSKSFKKILKEEKIDTKLVCPDINEETVKDSITAIYSTIELKANEIKSKAENFRNILFCLFGLFISFIALVGLSETKVSGVDDWLLAVAKFTLSHPFTVFSIFFVVLITSSFLLRVIDIGIASRIRNITRFLIAFKKRNAVFIVFSLGALILFLSILFFRFFIN